MYQASVCPSPVSVSPKSLVERVHSCYTGTSAHGTVSLTVLDGTVTVFTPVFVLISERFFPVVDLTSWLTISAICRTSGLLHFLSEVKNFPYLAIISVLIGTKLAARTFSTRYVCASWHIVGQHHTGRPWSTVLPNHVTVLIPQHAPIMMTKVFVDSC